MTPPPKTYPSAMTWLSITPKPGCPLLCYLLAQVIFWCQSEHGNLHIWLCTLAYIGAYCEMTKVPIVSAPG